MILIYLIFLFIFIEQKVVIILLERDGLDTKRPQTDLTLNSSLADR